MSISRILFLMIREASHDDIPSLVQMMDEFYAESDVELDHLAATHSFDALFDKPEFATTYIVNDGAIEAGYVVLTVCFSMEFGGFEGHIEDLYVRPVARRKGFGRDLLHALIVDCDDRKLCALSVEVAPDNVAARMLYAQLGLQTRTDERHVMTAKLLSSQGI
jgi:ribosomal protein S18 acetylase RimI-like enzyme